MEEMKAARAQLREIARDLEAIRYRLKGVHASVPLSPAESDPAAEVDVTTDPVAHFHLTNGARMERLNWLADRSGKGLKQSLGMMINYRYRLGEIDANHEAYTGEGRIITSSAVRSLVKAGG